MQAKAERMMTNVSERLKWIFVFLLAGFAVIANILAAGQHFWVRLATWVFPLAFAGLIIWQTEKGKALFEFVKEAQAELRKVVWPTKQEMKQTTWGVFFIVLVTGFILWLIDLGLFHLVGHLTGQRG